MTKNQLFKLLDELAAGFAREAAMSPEEVRAKRDEIVAWFTPRYARLQAAYFANPCPIPWRLVIREDVEPEPAPTPHECADCFNALYEEWKRARGRRSILDAPVNRKASASVEAL